MATKKKTTKKGTAKKGSMRGGSVGASIAGGRELSRGPGRATGSVAMDLMQNRGPSVEGLMRAAATAEKSTAGTILRLQRALERVLKGVKEGALPPVEHGLTPHETSPDYFGFRFDGFFTSFRRNASRSEPFIVEVLSVSAISPSDAQAVVEFDEKKHARLVTDAKVLEIYTFDPLTFVEGPWFQLLDEKIVTMNQEISDKLSNDPKARQKREQKEQNEREFRDSFVREHGLGTGI